MSLLELPPRELFTLGLVAAVGLQRLAEMAHSRRNLRDVEGRHADPCGNWPAMIALHALWIVGIGLELGLRGRVAPTAVFVLGLLLFGAGQALRLWAILSLGRSWNAKGIVSEQLAVVDRGPYRYLRHPNYTGVLVEWIGLPLAAGAYWTLGLSLLPYLVVQLRRLRGEDVLLAELPGYSERMGSKPALFPRLFPSQSERA